MPTYELSLIVRAALSQPKLKDVIRRTCTNILDKGAFIRSMENLGTKQLPYKMKGNTEGSYILINFDSPPNIVVELNEDHNADKDIIRSAVLKADDDFVPPCLETPCKFGELEVLDHERRVWKRSPLKKALKIQERMEKQRKVSK